MENVIQATRGCPHQCAFCGVNHFFKGTFRTRPVPEVIEDIQSMRGFRFLFTDDHLTANREYSKELFRALIPLKKKWMGMTCLTIADDDELLVLARRSGCVGLFLGFETVNPDNLASIAKYQNNVGEYRRIKDKLHGYGISVTAGTIFGFDHDKASVFETSLETFRDLGFDMIQVAPLTPFPGSPLHAQLKKEGRLIAQDVEDYDIYNVTYQPKRMTPDELRRGLEHLRRRFYTFPSAIRRSLTALHYGGFMCAYMVLILNLGYWRNHRAGIGYPP
jgi:radical SAM superfamily enzyme YgiQ (UPF0313 family)